MNDRPLARAVPSVAPVRPTALQWLRPRPLKPIRYFQSALKGQSHKLDIVFEGLNNLISTFCVCADGFQDLSKLLTTLYNYELLFASLKLTY
jgi:hypothetical protein